MNKKQNDLITGIGEAFIDWTNPKAKISKYFTVHEALYLRKWKIYHIPSEAEKLEILKLAKKLDVIRENFGPIIVHCFIRPTYVNNPYSIYHGRNYNKAVGSTATKSAHIVGAACDFHVKYYKTAEKCAEIRSKIKPLLKGLDLRMEDISGNWLHLDTFPVKFRRFFKP